VVKVGAGVPTLMSGGPLREKPVEFLQDVRSVMDAGARGVVVGRNIFQSKNPVGMVKAVMAIVHEGKEPEEVARLVE
jgi:class I fructose-bisphosphate aldolase